jgi:hypothetical protein
VRGIGPASILVQTIQIITDMDTTNNHITDNSNKSNATFNAAASAATNHYYLWTSLLFSSANAICHDMVVLGGSLAVADHGQSHSDTLGRGKLLCAH